MANNLFANYADLIRSTSVAEIERDLTLGGRLNLHQEGEISVHYAPFDHINREARIALVGITPGRQQAINALAEAHRQLRTGADLASASRRAKEIASFSGSMRPNLVAQLDYIGLNGWLSIGSCAELFAGRSDLVHFTSALRYPVFVGGKNYSGTPAMTRTPVLRRCIETWLADEVEALDKAVFVPLGNKAAAALEHLAGRGLLDRRRILAGIQHPSGANAERVAYFLGRKSRAHLSAKTNPAIIDQARAVVVSKITALRAAAEQVS